MPIRIGIENLESDEKPHLIEDITNQRTSRSGTNYKLNSMASQSDIKEAIKTSRKDQPKQYLDNCLAKSQDKKIKEFSKEILTRENSKSSSEDSASKTIRKFKQKKAKKLKKINNWIHISAKNSSNLCHMILASKAKYFKNRRFYKLLFD